VFRPGQRLIRVDRGCWAAVRDGTENTTDQGRKTDDRAHQWVSRALVCSPVLFHPILLVREGDCDSVSAVQEGGVMAENLVSPVTESHAGEMDDLCPTGFGRGSELAGSHSIKVGHDCKFCYDGRR
jgi:hypothetical protein